MTTLSNEAANALGDRSLGNEHGGDGGLASQFMAHYARLHRMVEVRLDRRLHARVNPSDVLQETYIEVARSLPAYLGNPRIPFFLWIRHIAGVKLMALHRRHLGTKVRAAGREVSLDGGVQPRANSGVLAAWLLGRLTSPSQAAVRSEVREQVQDALADLAPLDREVLSLRHFEQLSNAEAALVLGISEAAASNRYVRALKRLRPILLGTPGFVADPGEGAAGSGGT